MTQNRRHSIPGTTTAQIGFAASGHRCSIGVMDLMAEITSDEVLDLAYAWLCRRRERTSHNNDARRAY